MAPKADERTEGAGVNINSAFPSNYIKASDLMGKAVQVVIKDVKVEQIGRDKDAKPVLSAEAVAMQQMMRGIHF